MHVVAIIPAREGSKQLPRKNLLPLLGEPLIVHTIRAALAAERVDRVIVSTDSDEIAAVARTAGAEVVLRPRHLAADDSPTEDALLHVLSVLDPSPDYVVTLEPTSPLRTPGLIDACVERAVDMKADAVMTVAESRESWGRLDSGIFQHLRPGEPRRRQLREPLYRDASSVYVTSADHLRRAKSVIARPLYAVIVPEEEAVDINSSVDFVVAEALMRHRERGHDGS